MKYILFIYLFASLCTFGEECTVHVKKDGPWGFGPDVLFEVSVESRYYKNFDTSKAY